MHRLIPTSIPATMAPALPVAPQAEPRTQERGDVAREDVARGVLLSLAAIFLFQMVNALGKWTATLYPIGELVFFRSAFALLPVCLVILASGPRRILRAHDPRAVLVRAALWSAMLICSLFAYKLLPIAQATAIGFSAPLFVAFLAGPLLAERVGARRWVAILGGFLGVLIILKPDGLTLQPGLLWALGNALFYALGTLATRHASRTENSLLIVFACCLMTAIGSGVLLPSVWVTPRMADLVALAALGLLGGLAQLCATQALFHAAASRLAPLSYTALVWSALIGLFVWGEVPPWTAILGAAMIAASALYLARKPSPAPIEPLARASRFGLGRPHP